MKLKLPQSSYNWLSLSGAMIAIISLFMIVFLFIISVLFEQGGSYLGLVIYILLPSVLVLGLVLIPVGMLRMIHREKKFGTRKKDEWPRIDLNDVRHRNAFFIFTWGTVIFLLLSAIGSYEAFHYTESVEFCGTLCHKVMQPEYVAYQHSSHARVACVECHVGAGAGWYVRSKLSGLYQVYAVLANIYPRPIPTPIHNLRPARETCERCHWPQKFYAHTLRQERHYLSDEENTPWDIKLRMKIGSELSALGLEEGIHWHINPEVKVEYISTDEKRLELPWVRMTNLKTGEEKTFIDKENQLDDALIDSAEIRVMDCMDCHNRPSHNYKPPAFFVDEAITSGLIPRSLPEIKSVAMDICDNDFSSTDSAMQFIDSSIRAFYEESYPEIAEKDSSLIEKAITGLQNIFKHNIFPEMRVKWSEYPNHIGHVEFDGCFRCHNDRHETEEGEIISKDCNLCHNIVAQGTTDDMEYISEGHPLEFRHPEDIDEEWRESLCTECHTGLNP